MHPLRRSTTGSRLPASARSATRQRSGGRVADLAVAGKREPVVERRSGCILLVLQARQPRPQHGEDAEQADHPGRHPQTDHGGATLTDSELRSASPVKGHARLSSFKSPDSTRKAKVALMIEKMTTTIAYADADP